MSGTQILYRENRYVAVKIYIQRYARPGTTNGELNVHQGPTYCFHRIVTPWKTRNSDYNRFVLNFRPTWHSYLPCLSAIMGESRSYPVQPDSGRTKTPKESAQTYYLRPSLHVGLSIHRVSYHSHRHIPHHHSFDHKTLF